ncbi:hypothetical protein OX284_010150 [Flavobacterium sp. SUN046]|uniref:hypothetical protein n=1 Tax=Flavobacterium sp. SUN046 TaxID=3002440 RepID=UPI002DBBBDC0|nr:hypothetical protein [Flavobacterium sp. SUN046]MEC4049789.1 hypothetical protein [Flavobacterium sp. SUN046]
MSNYSFVKSFRTFVFSLSFVMFYILFNCLFPNDHKKIHLAMLWTAFYYTYFSLRNNFITSCKGVIIINIPFVFILGAAYLLNTNFSMVLYSVFLVPIASLLGFYFYKMKSMLIILLIMLISFLVYTYSQADVFKNVKSFFE